MLVAVHQHNRQAEPKTRSIACPGLGTCTGMVAPEEAARQMALAYRLALEPPVSISWELNSTSSCAWAWRRFEPADFQHTPRKTCSAPSFGQMSRQQKRLRRFAPTPIPLPVLMFSVSPRFPMNLRDDETDCVKCVRGVHDLARAKGMIPCTVPLVRPVPVLLCSGFVTHRS